MFRTTAAKSIQSRECAEISIRVASNRADREGAYRLLQHAYLRAELCEPSPSGMRITPYQILESTDTIVADLRGEIISTLSLVRDGELGLPMESIYPQEVAERRAAGLRVAEVSCLADRRSDESRFFALFSELARVMVQMADYDGVDQLLIAVHPRHARMYRRAMAFTQIGEDRDYPAVKGNPAVPMCLDLEWVKAERPEIWQRFAGDPLPLDVIQSRPMSERDRRHFAAIGGISRRLEREVLGEPISEVSPRLRIACA